MSLQTKLKQFLLVGHRKTKRSAARSDNDRQSSSHERPPAEPSQAPIPTSVVTSTAVPRNDSANNEPVPAIADPTCAHATTSSATAVKNVFADTENPSHVAKTSG